MKSLKIDVDKNEGIGCNMKMKTKEKPLSLHKSMRLNVVSGLQTQHREPIKPQPIHGKVYYTPDRPDWGWHIHQRGGFQLFPRYQVGDKLWRQEPYQIIDSDVERRGIYGTYQDDGKSFEVQLTKKEWDLFAKRKQPLAVTSGRSMYKSLARHWFEVTGVKAERVQDISEEDAKAEGLELVKLVAGGGWRGVPNGTVWSAAKWAFQELWDSCYGEGAWDRNDWVWAYTFKGVKK